MLQFVAKNAIISNHNKSLTFEKGKILNRIISLYLKGYGYE